ncbi:DUF4231 domain-containing protein [Thermoleptolyngbya sp. C42_A2020_037]|uniref:DUF4231 domain-containing protein n=1 Tax=Thermoleptolyngbya sp. C42_A2020_037 TaxID=2747799 RepID=UPI0019FA8FD5|nr:DUF4231 domain-containing protein [Thermoleptolyngbya sp. C42_A2020_037]MBF2084273.1 DUF4231 domain-containing protein [Thermoleptolyngbya sp. C42_A2020_037]
MASKDPYREQLKQDFGTLFNTLELDETQRHYLRSRWLDQVLWMENKAGRARDRYYRLRLTTIIGGVLVPVLVSLNNVDNRNADAIIRWSTVGISTVVAACAAVEEFFKYGERWRHYRRSVESLKTQGWQFSQLTGLYAQYPTHEEAFDFFASQVEDIIQKDVETYSTTVATAKRHEDSAQQRGF